MKVNLLQLEASSTERKTDRVERVCQMVEAQQADLVVLPELWSTGYFSFDNYRSEGEALDGPTCAALGKAAVRSRTYLVAGSIIERDVNQKLYNTVVAFSPDGDLVHAQRKIHLFGHESREAQLLEPADTTSTLHLPWGTLATATCYDLRFPEVFRLLIDQGAELLVIPAAWPSVRAHAWETLLQARAIENQAWVVGCNGAGTQHGVELAGRSAVIDPDGMVVARANRRPQVLRAEIDLERVSRARSVFPVLNDRRLAIDPIFSPVGRSGR